jgi:hypothetical protein
MCSLIHLLYRAFHDHDRFAIGLLVVFGVFVSVRVGWALWTRSRRKKTGTAAPAPTAGPVPAAPPQSQPPAPVPVPPAVEKEPNHLGRANAPVALFGLVGAALWWGKDMLPRRDPNQEHSLEGSRHRGGRAEGCEPWWTSSGGPGCSPSLVRTPTPPADLERRFFRLRSVRVVALEVLGGRRAKLLADPLKVTVDGVVTMDLQENLKGIERQIEQVRQAPAPDD